MTNTIKAITFGVAGLLLAGCATAAASDRPAPDSDLLPELARTIDDVGYEVFLAAAGDSANTVVSPASIGLGFGMADAGASGSVADAFEQAFGFPGEGEGRLAAFNAYEQALSIAPGTKGKEESSGKEVTLPTVLIANRMFTDTDFSPHSEYTDLVEHWFGAGAEAVPMRSNPGKAADAINSWIDDRTEGLIQDLVSADSFNDASRLTLLNALYMKATWREEMDPGMTRDRTFTRLDSTEVEVPMMQASDTASAAAQGDSYVAAKLAYAGDVLEMVVIVPDTGAFADVRAALGSELLEEIDAASERGDFTVMIPRFEAESTLDLRHIMEQQLGWTGVFGEVGFDVIGDELMIASAIHATKVIVDEEGTEAAAVTDIGMGVTSMPMPVLEVIADRPFLYVIRDVDTGAALFVGQVLDPTL